MNAGDEEAPDGPREQQVKGLTFLTARKHFIAQLGEEGFGELIDPLDDELCALFTEAELNGWYPESQLRTFIYRVHGHLANGDDERFMELARDLALAGISRFFRMLMNLASARFVLRKVPVVWTRLRRGPATLEAEVTDDGRVLVHYRDYCYSDDAVYRLLSVANCQALVVAATGKVPVSEVETFDANSMTLSFVLPQKKNAKPSAKS